MNNKSNKITFQEGNVLPNQLQNKTGNLSETLYMNNLKSTPILGITKELEKSYPAAWNSMKANDANMEYNGLNREFNIFMQQAELSEYYQRNPWGVLEHSKKYGYKGPQPGGEIRLNYSPI